VRREDLEHVVAAAAKLTEEDEFVVIGSQPMLGAVPEPPDELLQSMEADIYPLHRPELGDRIEGALGDGSPFQQQFGYFAHAVDPGTARAPLGWEDRLIRVEIPPRLGSERNPVAWCLEPHDLVLAKLARGSQRDWEYARAAAGAGLVSRELLLARADDLPVAAEHRRAIVVGLKVLAPPDPS